MIALDTTVLVDALTGPRRSAPALRTAIERGHRILLPSLVLFEWLRGPRQLAELEAQEALFPGSSALPFGPEEAALAADLYREVRRARGREINLAIAACARTHGAALWTLNPRDFDDVPDLELWTPAATG